MRGERLKTLLEERRGDCVRRRRAVAWMKHGALGVLAVCSACSGAESERLSCADVLPAGSVEFSSLQALIQRSPRGGGCLAEPCHSASAQSGGIRLDEPRLVYEELSTRPELFYGFNQTRIEAVPVPPLIRVKSHDVTR